MKDKSQASVGTHLICDAIFNNHCTTAGEGIFKITERLVKLQSRRLIVSCTMCTWAVSGWKMQELATDLEYCGQQLLLSVITLIFTRLRQLSHRCRLILICWLMWSVTSECAAWDFTATPFFFVEHVCTACPQKLAP